MTGVPFVVVREPGRVALHLLVHEPIELGRDGSGLLFDDPLVSARHLRLEQVDEVVVVVDLGSTNSTTLDGRAITAPVPLAPGSVVRLGDIVHPVLWAE